jgi:hypothetical protein
MKGLELLEKNPNVAKLICNYYLEMMIESLKNENLPEDFKQSIREEGIDNQKIAAILEGNPRNLFDFFDDRSIYIDIKADFDGTFQYALLDGNVSNLGSLEKFKTRKEADAAAIESAILTLENKLNLLDNDNKNS